MCIFRHGYFSAPQTFRHKEISALGFFGMGTFRHWDFSTRELFSMWILWHGTLLHEYISALGYFGTMHIQSTINIWKRCSSKPFGQTKNGLVTGKLACTSSKIEILNKIVIILILNFQVNLECFFTQKTWKVKIITHDLNHDLIFYCTHNQLCVPQ